MTNRVATYQGHKFNTSIEYSCGFPQGSISGPLLWIIVANTLLSQIEENTDFANDKFVAFADDILFVHKSRIWKSSLLR